MSDEIINQMSSYEELISVPLFLSNELGASTYASSCGSYQCTGGCQAEQDDPCTTLAMTCGNSQNDCGACQNGGESCGVSESGSCDSCQGFSQCSTCETSCMTNCQRYSQGGCSTACESSVQEEPVIDYWYWDSSNGSATTAQTKRAYAAITGYGATTDFSYKVWNDLVDKIYEAKQAAGFSWNAKYASLSDTKMSSSDKVLTATRFNSARYNVGIHVSTGITDVYSGDPVYGWYFETITDSLNEWIASI